ncbi:MAG: carboxypeptidase-like regulatory domain-containing protein [Chitinophagales bacterium]|nr:carboxypeptidase-like regulatory domain-containing protein [Chitinophagales bacterium]|tara:strand:+ start:4041 stop:4676 length:636 start_codon:yes stop_codon:yes gene_type:complete
MLKYLKILLFLMLGLISNSFAQENQKKVIQFSGYVLTPDTLMGIPFVTVQINNSSRGTISNREGFFSFAASVGDTVNFSSIGFEDSYYYLPTSLQTNKYSIVKLLSTDTYYIDTVTVYPWPSKEMFKQAFLSLEIEENDVDRALKNLEREYLKEMGENMAMDASENANYYLRSEAQKYYYAGQAPPQNIFNVFAWAQFIEAWKRGDFRRKK